MRIADYLADTLYQAGVADIFIVTGGGLMFLTDGVACHKHLRPVPCLHEQAAAMAAIGYAQYRCGYGACYVTTGCGGTNTVTGVLHAWQDHIPVVFVSGQCNRDEMMTIAKAPVRAIGQQEADIVSIVKSITKYAITIMEPENAVYEIEKAMYLAKQGCWGPVWLDIPMDVQEAVIDPGTLRHFDPAHAEQLKTQPTEGEISRLCSALEEAERPLVILGAGVRDSGAEEAFERFIHRYQIPYVGTRRGWDICPKADPLHVGLADIRGNRSANMAMQNADLLLVLGSRLSMFTTGYNYGMFARGAKQVIVVDIDPDEHRKGTVHLDQVINADVGAFLSALPELRLREHRAWTDKCIHWKEVFPVFTPDQEDDSQGISKFGFIRLLNQFLKRDSVVVTDAGATTEFPMQGLFYTTRQQRYIGSAEQCEMGYALPAAVGVSIARSKRETLCIVGDGSLQMNLQELQTCVTQKLPAKIFVWNNGGYGTIRGHQKTIFKGRFVGVDPESGTAFPPLDKIADAYGIRYYQAKTLAELEAVIPKVLAEEGPVLCEVFCWKEEANPMVKAKYARPDGSRIALPPEDMFPPVSRELFESEMLIEPIRWWE